MSREWLAAVTLLAVLMPLAAHHSLSAGDGRSIVVVAPVKGVIDGSIRDYVVRALEYAEKMHASAVVLELNTPGGSLDAALDIVEMLERSPTPVIGFARGRWAVSAGTMILMCTSYAAMEPGTVIGAVQPVELTSSGEYRPVNESKVLNPVYKKIEACMRLHGRNTSLAREFVYHNLVLDAEEAVRLHAVEAVARSLWELLEKANNTVVETIYGPVRLTLIEPRIVYYGMPPGLRLAHILSDPLVSSLLTTMAVLVIIAAIASGHPLAIAAGIALMLLGLFGLGLSASVLAAALMLVGAIMLIAELALIPGFGVVGITGILLLLIGGFIMFAGKPIYIAGESLHSTLYTLLAATVPIAGLTLVVVYKAARAWRLKPIYQPSPVGKRGKALDDIPPGGTGFVLVEGEYWQARNTGDKPIRRGDMVLVVGKEGAILLVRLAPEAPGSRESRLG